MRVCGYVGRLRRSCGIARPDVDGDEFGGLTMGLALKSFEKIDGSGERQFPI
jgi:hypothetical protein